MTDNPIRWQSVAPPSGLPAISPSRGEIMRLAAFANFQRYRSSETGEAANLPLEGEMAGRPEGGAVPPTSQGLHWA
ncbi:MAG: propionyl-coenzyme A carboxylase alpha polypeptide [Mesorhizobium sp.]|nr:MAG: propionyl-coenzyme A carboxylase alpha polypeptide [Mesorhizobium sp.]RWC59333.1 MAG: propionyl-coenzyme A carboxylase alpha polypeptide [Mesorhizobium sp.]